MKMITFVKPIPCLLLVLFVAALCGCKKTETISTAPAPKQVTIGISGIDPP